jgi:hypothetical protein
MTAIVTELWEDIIFDLPDGRQICVSIYKDGRVRLMERPNTTSTWGPSVEGEVAK